MFSVLGHVLRRKRTGFFQLQKDRVKEIKREGRECASLVGIASKIIVNIIKKNCTAKSGCFLVEKGCVSWRVAERLLAVSFRKNNTAKTMIQRPQDPSHHPGSSGM